MRRTWKKYPKRRTFGTKMARRRKTWAQFNIDPCDSVTLEHCPPTDGCCTDIARIELLGNQQLQDLYSDRCSVVRVLGDLYFSQVFGTVTGVSDITAWLNYLNASQHFLGLRRGEITSQQPTLPSLDIWDTAFDDLSEGQWFKTWQRLDDNLSAVNWMQGNNDASGFTLTLPVRGSDVHTEVTPGVPGCSILTTGSGNICIATDMEDDCLDCGQALTTGQITFSSAQARLHAPWHVHLDVKKRIPLRENQGLYLVYNLRHWNNPGPASADSFTRIFGNVRTLIEMG